MKKNKPVYFSAIHKNSCDYSLQKNLFPFFSRICYYHNMKVFVEYPVLVPVVTGISVQLFKLCKCCIEKKFQLSWRDIIQSGGFPSAHTAFVCSVLTTIFLREGIHSLLFAASFVFAVLFMFDAMRVRYEAGLHAKQLNRMLGEQKYIERLGHTPFQVFAGALFGIGISLFLLFPSL